MALSITWHGLSCFRIQSKIRDEDVVVVTDPYDSSCGLRVPKTLEANVVSVSKNHPCFNNTGAVRSLRNDRKLFVIDSSGEYEVNGIFVYGISSSDDPKKSNIIYRFEMDGISIAHLGLLSCELQTEEMEVVGDVDILLVPTGGEGLLETKKIADIISQIEPRVVIPMNYQIDGIKNKVETPEKLFKEMGIKNYETVNKLKIAKKDFGEDMKVFVIEKD